MDPVGNGGIPFVMGWSFFKKNMGVKFVVKNNLWKNMVAKDFPQCSTEFLESLNNLEKNNTLQQNPQESNPQESNPQNKVKDSTRFFFSGEGRGLRWTKKHTMGLKSN